MIILNVNPLIHGNPDLLVLISVLNVILLVLSAAGTMANVPFAFIIIKILLFVSAVLSR